MIGYLRGKFLHRDGDDCVLDVNQVGYLIHTRKRILDELQSGVDYSFFIQPIFKEQLGLSLYGFESSKEKKLFNQLLKVNKVGAKLALTILDNISPEELVSAIIDKQVNILSSVKGIGQKTSERIILELSDKLKKEFKGSKPKKGGNDNSYLALIRDLESILGNLGYQNKQIKLVLGTFQKSDYEDNTLENLIKIALKRIGGI